MRKAMKVQPAESEAGEIGQLFVMGPELSIRCRKTFSDNHAFTFVGRASEAIELLKVRDYHAIVIEVGHAEARALDLFSASKNIRPYSAWAAVASAPNDQFWLKDIGFDLIVARDVAMRSFPELLTKLVIMSQLKRQREAMIVALSGVESALAEFRRSPETTLALGDKYLGNGKPMYKAIMELLERSVIEACMKMHPNNKKECAYALGMSYFTFLLKEKKLGLRKPSGKLF